MYLGILYFYQLNLATVCAINLLRHEAHTEKTGDKRWQETDSWYCPLHIWIQPCPKLTLIMLLSDSSSTHTCTRARAHTHTHNTVLLNSLELLSLVAPWQPESSFYFTLFLLTLVTGLYTNWRQHYFIRYKVSYFLEMCLTAIKMVICLLELQTGSLVIPNFLHPSLTLLTSTAIFLKANS